ncbi:hypothetical protein [Botrimarina sp.]|uniref:hypothetical protein n=1 Tax=Botrimarina sp. TaxID=2795802 RepID=UPI0032ED8B7B
MVTRLVMLALTAGLVLGCRHGAFTVREQELCCPTDVRQKHCWCWGEDSIFDTPCAVDEAYHGHKPTCWREWDAPAAVWRDEFCGVRACQAGIVHEGPVGGTIVPGSEVISDQPTLLPPESSPAAPSAEAVASPPPAEPSRRLDSAPAPEPAPDDRPAPETRPAPAQPDRIDTIELPELPAAPQSRRGGAPAYGLPTDAELTNGPLPTAPALAMPSTDPKTDPAPEKEFELRIIQETGYTPKPRNSSRTPYGFDFVK